VALSFKPVFKVVDGGVEFACGTVWILGGMPVFRDVQLEMFNSICGGPMNG